MENEGLGIQRIGLFNQALLGKWLWWFRSETIHLWRPVIATKYGMSSGGWCTRVSRGAQDVECGRILAKVLGVSLVMFYNVAGEGFRIQFWYDLWCGQIPLKDLYPDLFSRDMGKEASIFELITISSNGGSRSWNIQFHKALDEWEEERVFSFYEHVYSKCLGVRELIVCFGSQPRMVFLMCTLSIIPYLLLLPFLSLGSVFGVLRYLEECLSFYGLQLRIVFLLLTTL